MKLQEFSTTRPTENVATVFENYFDSKLVIDRLGRSQCRNMLQRVQQLLGESRRTSDFHNSERNPAYLKLVMLEQALAARLQEMTPPPAAPKPAQTTIDPKLKAAQDKIKKGITLSAEEQKLVNDSAAAMAEGRLRRAYRTLKESEVQQAQVVLAAQDMVDKMQGMLEDVSELQFKELPALVDSIKNQVGIDQATQFNSDATAALTGLMQNLQGAKQQLDNALGVVTGQQTAVPGMEAGADLAAAGADMAAGVQAADAGMDELDAVAPEADTEIAPPPEETEPASAAALGRGRR